MPCNEEDGRMHGFIAKLEHMQRNQDRHLVRVGKQLKSIARSGGSTEVMVRLLESLRAREEERLDPAARELASIMPAAYEHYARAVDLLVTIIGTMATNVNGTTLDHVDDAVRAGFSLIVLLDDVDFVAGLSDQGDDMHALRIVAQFLSALKGWLLMTERLIERTATRMTAAELQRIAESMRHIPTSEMRKVYTKRLRPQRDPSTPKEPRPPEGA